MKTDKKGNPFGQRKISTARYLGHILTKIYCRKGTGGPQLNWYEVQPTLSAWEGHTLMILDCCYALQAARDRDSQTLELLAASGLRERTPGAGEWSFTSALLEVMSNMVQENRPVIIEEVYKRLIRLEHVLATTPIRMILRGEESIELKSNGLKSSRPSLKNQEPLALLSLRISLSRTFDVKAMENFQRWMRTHVPRGISAITVQDVFLKTASIQAFLQQHTTSDLQAAISEDLQSRNHVETLLLQPPLSESDDLQGGQGAEAVEAQAALDKLREWNEQVYQSLQSNLLLNPSFYSEAEMERTLLSGPARAIGLSDAARLRLLNIKLEDRPALENVPALPFGQVKREAIPGIHRTAMHTYGKIGETVVFIERRVYNASLPRENVVRKVKRLARLLKEASTAAFHTAPFEGYIDEPSLSSFGLVFQAPLRSLKEGRLNLSLEDAYGKERYMPLNVRLGIAVALARALSNLHAVGWLHKSLCSGHVLFFSKQHDESSDEARSRFDYSRPFLFGFDLSRPLLGSSDNTKEFRRSRQIYTHPDRWGTPRETFCPSHDIYSMGVILLEIGCWRAAKEFDRTKKRFEEVNDEKKVREELVAAAKTYLPHCAGEQYCNAVVACLSGFPDGEARDREDPSKLHKAFGLRVLELLLRASACL
jgi:hypothetical protein